MKPAPPVTRTLTLIWPSLRAYGREKAQNGAVEAIGMLEEEAVATRQHGEPGAWNPPGQRLGERRGREDVVPANQDQGRHAEGRQAFHPGAVPRRDALGLTLDGLRLRLVRVRHRALEGRLHVLRGGEEVRRQKPRVDAG